MKVSRCFAVLKKGVPLSSVALRARSFLFPPSGSRALRSPALFPSLCAAPSPALRSFLSLRSPFPSLSRCRLAASACWCFRWWRAFWGALFVPAPRVCAPSRPSALAALVWGRVGSLFPRRLCAASPLASAALRFVACRLGRGLSWRRLAPLVAAVLRSRLVRVAALRAAPRPSALAPPSPLRAAPLVGFAAAPLGCAVLVVIAGCRCWLSRSVARLAALAARGGVGLFAAAQLVLVPHRLPANPKILRA